MTQSATVETFDVFLSHSSVDSDVVERIAEKLQLTGMKPWLDSWELVGGDRFQREIGHGVDSSSACAVFLGPSGFRDWVQEEIDYAHDRAVSDVGEFRLFLVLLPGAPDPINRSTLPPCLRTRSWVDLRAGIDDGFQKLVNAIRGEVAGPPVPSEIDTSEQPYRGLAPFSFDDSKYFFGRTRDVQQLLELLRGGRFLAVLGPSGAGKSSLVRAGLLPALAAGGLPGSASWLTRVFKPGAQPLVQLTAQLSGFLPHRSMISLLADMRDRRTLDLESRKILASMPDDAQLVWVVDQFEELFTVCTDKQQCGQFLDALIYAATVPQGRTVVVLTMRSDFYSDVAAHDELSVLMGGRSHLVSPLGVRALVSAIEGPARIASLEFQPGLVDRILDDVPPGPASLPLMQDALLDLWQRRHGRTLTHRAYTEIGGVGGSLALRAEKLYEGLTAAEKKDVRFILTHRLVRVEDRAEPVSRRAPVAALVPHGEDPSGTRHLVERLVDARLISIVRDEDAESDLVEVAHETLIRGWPRLGQWIDEDRAEIIEHRLMAEAARRWSAHEKDAAYLFRGDRLRGALRFAARIGSELNETERAFLEASLYAERAVVRRRYYGQAGGGAVGMAMGFGVALSILLAARADDPQLSVLLFLAAWPLGLLVGLGVGLSVWFVRRWRRLRWVVPTLVAALVGSVSYSAVMYAVFLTLTQAFLPVQLATGALLAAPLGAAVGARRRRGDRAIALLVAGVLAAMVATLPGKISAVWWSVPLAGLFLGGLAAIGFAVVHVRREDEEILEFEEGWTR